MNNLWIKNTKDLCLRKKSKYPEFVENVVLILIDLTEKVLVHTIKSCEGLSGLSSLIEHLRPKTQDGIIFSLVFFERL